MTNLLQRHRQCRYRVIVRAALMPREHGLINCRFQLKLGFFALLVHRPDPYVNSIWNQVFGNRSTFSVEDHGTSGTSQGLVRCGRHNVGELERIAKQLGSNQARYMGHIVHKIR
jgi:hypothetical protein